MNTTSAAVSRSWRSRETKTTQAARDQNARAIVLDARFQALLNRTDRQVMRTLLLWHDPLTGYLKSRTRAYNIMDRLDISESTLRRARRRLICFGLIVSYVPGDGRIASTYCVARSWDEAEAAVKLRESLGDDAPHFPELVDRTPSAVNKRPAPPAGADEGQDEETDEEREAAKERLDRAKRRRGVRGPVPPEIPNSSVLPEILEAEERKADAERQGDTNERGAASLRAALAAANGAA